MKKEKKKKRERKRKFMFLKDFWADFQYSTTAKSEQ